MKSLLSIVALCSFSFAFASEQDDVPNCSLFRYMFGAPKVSLENLKSAVENRDYCKVRAILRANQSRTFDIAEQYILSKVLAPGFDFESLCDAKAVESGLTESINASPAVVSRDKILSCKAYLDNNPTSDLRVMLGGVATAQQVLNLLKQSASFIEKPFFMLSNAYRKAGKHLGYEFASGSTFSKEEDRCKAMIEFFEKAGYSTGMTNSSAIADAASAEFRRHYRDNYGRYTSCDINGYLIDRICYKGSLG